MANDEQLAVLRQGAAVWNPWVEGARRVDLSFRADLLQAELGGMDLTGVDFRTANLLMANLSGANLMEAKLVGANLLLANLRQANLIDADLTQADLTDADLSLAHLDGADLRGAQLNVANLGAAILSRANLRDADLMEADLSGANLGGTDISGAKFIGANFTDANVAGIKWDGARMHGRYRAIRGIDSCYGGPLFKRAAADQAFIDAVEDHWKDTWRIWLFRAWGLLDYGRSMSRVAAFGFAIMCCYGMIYSTWKGLLNYTGSANTWFTSFYFSIETFTTLGFGDVKPTGIVGELLASSEVIIGYITLGLLLAVLAEKIARRA